MDASEYNYDHFDPKYYDFKHFAGPKPGERFIDFEAMTLEGKRVFLSEYLNRPVVLDTGSITCPVYASTTKAMNRLQEQYPDVHFLLLYVREAHPGSRTGSIKSMQEKLEHARLIHRYYDEKREILVDSVDGKAHRAYGSMPNMTYLIGTDGIVRFRANWTNIDALEKNLQTIDTDHIERQDFYTLKKPLPWIAVRTLLIGGVDALVEFLMTLPQLLRQHEEVASKS